MAKKKESKEDTKIDHPWKKRLVRMRRFQEENSKTWKRNKRLIFGGKGTSDAGPGSETPHGSENKLAYGWGLYKTLETQIYVKNPECFVSSYDPNKKETAKRLTSIVAWDLDKMDVKGRGNLLLADSFIAGYGALIESVETEKDERPSEVEGQESEIYVKSQQFIVRRVHYWDILFDPQGKLLDLSDHRYIACAFYPTIQSLKDDPTYKNLPDDIEDFPEASEVTRHEKKPGRDRMYPSSTNSAETDIEYKTIAVWEIWDQTSKKIFYVTDNGYHLIGEKEWPVEFVFGGRHLFPVTLLYMHAQPDSFYPVPEIDLIAPQLDELNEIEGMLREDSLTKWRKYLVADTLVGADQASKFTDTAAKNCLMTVAMDDLQSIMGTQNMHSMDLNKLVVKMEDVTPPRDLFPRKAGVEADIMQIIGYGPGDRGGMPSTRSAREAMMVFERQNQKLSKRLDAITDFYSDVIRKHITWMKALMVESRYAKIIGGKPGLDQFFQYSKDDIEGDFDFFVLPGTSAPKTTESMRQLAMQEFQALAPIVQQAGGDIRALVTYAAEFMGWKSVDDIWANQKQSAKELAATLMAFEAGQAQPQQLLEAASKMVMSELTQPEVQALKQQIQDMQGGQGSAKGSQGMRGDPNQGGMPPMQPMAGPR